MRGEKMKINEAYFGVGTRDFNTGEMTFWNLFANGRVKWSVAKYITMTNEMKKTLRTVYDALTEKGYDPINQLVGYIL